MIDPDAMVNGQTQPESKSDQYQCQSYFDDTNTLVNCTCGRCSRESKALIYNRIAEPNQAEARREADGKYGSDGNWDRLCACGHPLGVHAARNETGKRPCFNEDTEVWIDEQGVRRATGEECDCAHFRLSRKKYPEALPNADALVNGQKGTLPNLPSDNQRELDDLYVEFYESRNSLANKTLGKLLTNESMSELKALIKQEVDKAHSKGYRLGRKDEWRATNPFAEENTDER